VNYVVETVFLEGCGAVTALSGYLAARRRITLGTVVQTRWLHTGCLVSFLRSHNVSVWCIFLIEMSCRSSFVFNVFTYQSYLGQSILLLTQIFKHAKNFDFIYCQNIHASVTSPTNSKFIADLRKSDNREHSLQGL